MKDMAALPWEQLPDETDSAYLRFIFYRNAGTARSLDAAWRAYCLEGYAGETDDGVIKSKQAPGNWRRDCGENRWVERARAWDKAQVAAHGLDTVLAFVEGWKIAVQKAVAVIVATEPEKFSEAVDALNAAGKFISPETVSALHADAAALRVRDHEQPGPADAGAVRSRPGGLCEGPAAADADAGSAGDSIKPGERAEEDAG
jgi:hypothetical protein